MLTRSSVGRALRKFPITARALTEYRLYSLSQQGTQVEFTLARQLARPGSTAIDVGASVGNYALALWKAVSPQGQVIALEPNSAVFAELRNSTWHTGVEAIAAAASDKPGTALLYIPRADDGDPMAPLGSMEHPGEDQHQLAVQTLRLDDLRLKHPVSLIKVDVEGHESSVLAGARAIIRRDFPTLIVEIEQRHLRDETVAGVVAKLTSLGYACEGIAGSRLIPWADFDIQRHQLDLVVSPTELRRGGAPYVNNFVFWHGKSAAYVDPILASYRIGKS